MRSSAYTRLFGQNDSSPLEPKRQPGCQLGVANGGGSAREMGRTHLGLRREAHSGGQEQTRDHPLPEAVHLSAGNSTGRCSLHEEASAPQLSMVSRCAMAKRRTREPSQPRRPNSYFWVLNLYRSITNYQTLPTVLVQLKGAYRCVR